MPPIQRSSAPYGERDISLGKNGNLKVHAARTIALGGLFAVLVYVLITTTSSALIRRHYSEYGDAEAQKTEYATSLQEYVSENQILSRDRKALRAWTDEYKYLFISVYQGSLPISEEGFYYKETVNSRHINPVLKSQAPIAFSDGTYIVVFEDYRYIRYTQLWQLIAAGLAFWPLLTVALYWIRLLSKYISSLSLAARRINNGDLYSEVSVPPHASEEILSLAKSMDEMRTTFLDRLNEEKQRSHSNQELLTVMSHDIRTPLTTLIGYAEIMDKSPDLPEDERKQYSSIIYQRALRLKELTDEMFYYFLVYGSSDIQVDLAYYNAQVLIPQLINDRLSAFQDLDVEFQIQVIEYPFTVHTDISLLNRVFDNIFSNIRKYGDLTCPITIEMRRKEDNFIHIEIRNRIRDTNPDVESTHIGTKTCSKLMELLDGFFTFHSDEEFYTAEVLIPISYNRPADKL